MPRARVYSVFRHLGGALWLNHDPCRSCFMVYTMYYDASNKEEEVNRPLVVAGIAATESNWIQFETDWKNVLDKADVEFLDMAACAQWKTHPYDTWERKENIRAPFLASLAKVLTDTAAQIVIVRIIPKDYNAVNAQYEIASDYFRGAYAMAAIKCIALLEEMILAADPTTDGLAHIVEKGDTGQGSLTLLSSDGAPIAVQAKHDERTGRWFHAFGACDMVAYEYRKAIEKKIAKGTHRIVFRGLLRALQGIPTKKVYISQADLVALCEAAPQSFPRRNQ